MKTYGHVEHPVIGSSAEKKSQARRASKFREETRSQQIGTQPSGQRGEKRKKSNSQGGELCVGPLPFCKP